MADANAILLVEDDPTLLDLNKRVLEQEGYIIMPARNLREARESVEGINPQAVVLDVELPDGSGFDFCRELRKTRSVPIVFLTSLCGEEHEKAGYNAGADDYIVKPYCMERLVKSIKTLVVNSAASEQIKIERSVLE